MLFSRYGFIHQQGSARTQRINGRSQSRSRVPQLSTKVLHLSQSWARAWDSATSLPIRSLALYFHFFLSAFLLLPWTGPGGWFLYSNFSSYMSVPFQLSLLHCDEDDIVVLRITCSYLFVKWSFYEMPRSNLKHIIYAVWIFLCSSDVSTYGSHTYSKLDRTNAWGSLTFDKTHISLSFQIVFRFASAVVVCAALTRISAFDPSS